MTYHPDLFTSKKLILGWPQEIIEAMDQNLNASCVFSIKSDHWCSVAWPSEIFFIRKTPIVPNHHLQSSVCLSQ